MNCEAFLQLLPRYPDDMPDEETMQAFLLHAADCAECAARLAEQEAMLATLSALDDDLEVPTEFAYGWRNAIRNETPARRPAWYSRWQGWAAAAAVMVMVVGGTALMRGGYLFPNAPLSGVEEPATKRSVQQEPVYVDAEPETLPMMAEGPMPHVTMAPEVGGMAAYDDMDTGAAMDEGMLMRSQSAGAGQAQDESAVADQQPVLLRSASVQFNTAHFDVDLAQLTALVQAHEGRIEYQSVYGEALAVNPKAGRYATVTIRVPDEALDAFVSAAAGLGTLTYQEAHTEDISERYYDTQGRLSMYLTQRERLMALLEEADIMSDIIELETKLSEVQYTIESMQGRINSWNKQARDATVTVMATEIAPEGEFVRLPLGRRLQNAFTDSWNAVRAFAADALVFLIMAAPYLVGAVVLGFAAWGIIRVIRNRRRER